MKSIGVKFRKIVSYTLLGIGISFTALPSAYAQFFFADVFLFGCGAVNDSPLPPLPGADGVNFYSNSMVTTAGTENGDGLRRVTLKDVVRQHDANGVETWKRTLSVTGLPIAMTFGPPPFQSIVYFETLDLSGRPAAPFFSFGTACGAFGLVEHGGKHYALVGLGTVGQEDLSIPVTNKDKAPVANAATGSGTLALVKGRDKTIMNWWTLNPDNGNVVRLIKPRPRSGEFQIPNESGAYDIDNDGNAELVIVSGKFVGENFYDFIYRSYNIVTGALEKTTTIRQSNRQVIK